MARDHFLHGGRLKASLLRSLRFAQRALNPTFRQPNPEHGIQHPHLDTGRNVISLEQLEPRVLLSADALLSVFSHSLGSIDNDRTPTILLGGTPDDALSSIIGQEHFKQVVFVDPSVTGHEGSLNGLETGDSSPVFDVVILDADRDGVLQISEYLAGERGISALHLLSHGSRGSLSLGNTRLNTDTLGSYTELASWRDALTGNADILLYGCNVADGELGIRFVDRVAEVTGADVAASDDLTGNAQLGGDGVLEQRTGLIEASTLALDFDRVLADPPITNQNGPVLTIPPNGPAGPDATFKIIPHLPGGWNVTIDGQDPSKGTLDVQAVGDNLRIKVTGEGRLRNVQSGLNFVVAKGGGALPVAALRTPANNDHTTLDLIDYAQDGLVVTVGQSGVVLSNAGGHLLTITNVNHIIGSNHVEKFVFEKGVQLNGTLDGRDGDDTLSFTQWSEMVTVNLGQMVAGDFGTVSPITGGVKGIEIIEGGSNNDRLTAGADGLVTLRGSDGNDVLTGRGGTDPLEGGPGNDLLTGAGGNDPLAGGPGDDTYIYFDDWGADNVDERMGEGVDTLDFHKVGQSMTFAIDASGDGKTGIKADEGAANRIRANDGMNGAKFIERIIGPNGDGSTYAVTDWDDGLVILSQRDRNATLNLSAITDPVKITIDQTDDTVPGAMNKVTVELVDGGKSFTAYGIARIVGAKSDNTYVFANGATLPGGIGYTPLDAGGFGKHTIDYENFGRPVAVNLGGEQTVVAEPRVDVTDPGRDKVDEVRRLTLDAVGGSFKLTVVILDEESGELIFATTAAIPYDPGLDPAATSAALSAQIQVALGGLLGGDQPDVGVTGSGTNRDPWTITFKTPNVIAGLLLDDAGLKAAPVPQVSITPDGEARVVRITLPGADGGKFRIARGDRNAVAKISDPLDWNASASTIRDAINEFDGPMVTVSGTGKAGDPWTFTYPNEFQPPLQIVSEAGAGVLTAPGGVGVIDLVTPGVAAQPKIVEISTDAAGGTFTLQHTALPEQWTFGSDATAGRIKLRLTDDENTVHERTVDARATEATLRNAIAQLLVDAGELGNIDDVDLDIQGQGTARTPWVVSLLNPLGVAAVPSVVSDGLTRPVQQIFVERDQEITPVANEPDHWKDRQTISHDGDAGRFTVLYNGIGADIATAASTTLLIAITDDVQDDGVFIDSDDSFPTSGVIKIDQELILYTNLNGGDLEGVARGFNGTAIADHGEDAPVIYDSEASLKYALEQRAGINQVTVTKAPNESRWEVVFENPLTGAQQLEASVVDLTRGVQIEPQFERLVSRPAGFIALQGQNDIPYNATPAGLNPRLNAAGITGGVTKGSGTRTSPWRFELTGAVDRTPDLVVDPANLKIANATVLVTDTSTLAGGERVLQRQELKLADGQLGVHGKITVSFLGESRTLDVAADGTVSVEAGAVLDTFKSLVEMATSSGNPPMAEQSVLSVDGDLVTGLTLVLEHPNGPIAPFSVDASELLATKVVIPAQSATGLSGGQSNQAEHISRVDGGAEPDRILATLVPTTANLLQPIDEAAVEIEIDALDGFPDSGTIMIGDEVIRYTGKDGDLKLTGLVRGFNARAHAFFATVTLVDRPVLIDGRAGDEALTGGSGNDALDGGENADTLQGLEGDDILRGGDGNDRIEGGNGRDLLEGGDGVDVLLGGDGDDVLLGGGDDDQLDGGAGNDVLDGGPGHETLTPGAGYDVLAGGEDTDVYRFEEGFGLAQIVELKGQGSREFAKRTGGFKEFFKSVLPGFDRTVVDPGDVLDFSRLDGDYTHVLSGGTLVSAPGTLREGAVYTGTEQAQVSIVAHDKSVKGALFSDRANRLQIISHDGTAGTFRLTYTPLGAGMQTTVPIAHDAGATDMKRALESLPGIGRVGVIGGNGAAWQVTFDRSTSDVQVLGADTSGLVRPGGDDVSLRIEKTQESLNGTTLSSGDVRVALLGFAPGQTISVDDVEIAGDAPDAAELANATATLKSLHTIFKDGISQTFGSTIDQELVLLIDFGAGVQAYRVTIPMAELQNNTSVGGMADNTSFEFDLNEALKAAVATDGVVDGEQVDLIAAGVAVSFDSPTIHVPGTRNLVLTVAPDGTTVEREDGTYLRAASITVLPGSSNTVVVGKDAGVKGFFANNVFGFFNNDGMLRNIEQITASAGDNTFIFGNEYWGGDSGVGPLLAGLLPLKSQPGELVIDTSAIVAGGHDLVLDFRAINRELEFEFSNENGRTQLEVTKVFAATFPLYEIGPTFPYSRVVFTDVDENSIIYAGRHDNTFVVNQGFIPFKNSGIGSGVNYKGTLIGGTGATTPRDLFGVLDVVETALGYSSPLTSFVVQNTVNYDSNLGQILRPTIVNLSSTTTAGGSIQRSLAAIGTAGTDLIPSGLNRLSSTASSTGLTGFSGRVENIGNVAVGPGINIVRGTDFGWTRDPGAAGLKLPGTDRFLQLGGNTFSIGDVGVGESLVGGLFKPGIHTFFGGSGPDTYQVSTPFWGVAAFIEPPDIRVSSDLVDDFTLEFQDTLDFSGNYRDLDFTIVEVGTGNLEEIDAVFNAYRDAKAEGIPIPEVGMNVVFVRTGVFEHSIFQTPLFGEGGTFELDPTTWNVALATDIEHIVGGRATNTFHFVHGGTVQGSIAPGFGGDMVLDYSEYPLGDSDNDTHLEADFGAGGDTTLAFDGDPSLELLVNFPAPKLEFIFGNATGVEGSRFGGIDTLLDLTDGQVTTVKNFGVVEGGKQTTGTKNDDIIRGQSGDNLFIATTGNDEYYGGSEGETETGSDTVSYRDFTDPITIDLSNNTASDGDWTHALVDIENVEGGSNDDTITGGTEKNTYIFGMGFGHDTLTDHDGEQDVIDFGRFKDGDDQNTAEVTATRLDTGSIELTLADTSDKITLTAGNFDFKVANVKSFNWADGSSVSGSTLSGSQSTLALGFTPEEEQQAFFGGLTELAGWAGSELGSLITAETLGLDIPLVDADLFDFTSLWDLSGLEAAINTRVRDAIDNLFTAGPVTNLDIIALPNIDSAGSTNVREFRATVDLSPADQLVDISFQSEVFGDLGLGGDFVTQSESLVLAADVVLEFVFGLADDGTFIASSPNLNTTLSIDHSNPLDISFNLGPVGIGVEGGLVDVDLALGVGVDGALTFDTDGGITSTAGPPSLASDGNWQIELPIHIQGALAGMSAGGAVIRGGYNTQDQPLPVGQDATLSEFIQSIPFILEAEGFDDLLTIKEVSLDALLQGVIDVTDQLLATDGLAYASIPGLGMSAAELLGGQDEVQTLTVTGSPTGGSFSLSFDGEDTGLIDWSTTPAAVTAALEAAIERLSKVGDVVVEEAGAGTWAVTFVSPGNRDVPELELGTNGLTGGTNATVATATMVQGRNLIEGFRGALVALQTGLSNIQTLERDLNFELESALGIDFGLGDRATLEAAVSSLATVAFDLNGSSSDDEIAIAMAGSLPAFAPRLLDRDVVAAADRLDALGIATDATDAEILIALGDRITDLASLDALIADRDALSGETAFHTAYELLDRLGLVAAGEAEIIDAFDSTDDRELVDDLIVYLNGPEVGGFTQTFAELLLSARGLTKDSLPAAIDAALDQAAELAEVQLARLTVEGDPLLKAAADRLFAQGMPFDATDEQIRAALVDPDSLDAARADIRLLLESNIDIATARTALTTIDPTLGGASTDAEIAVALITQTGTTDFDNRKSDRDRVAAYDAAKSISIRYEDSKLDVDFDFEARLDPQQIGFQIDLAELVASAGAPQSLVDVVGPGGLLRVESGGTLSLTEAFAGFDLGFGFDLSDLSSPEFFVEDNTGIEVGLGLSASELMLDLIVGVPVIGDVGLFVEGGAVDIGLSGRFGLAGDPSDGRYDVTELSTDQFAFDVSGSAAVDLPLNFPAPGLPLGGSVGDLNNDGVADNVLHLTAGFDRDGLTDTEVVTPSLANGFSLFAMLNDPALVLAGLEGMFDGIRDHIAVNIEQLNLPLIGNKLAGASGFVDGLKHDLIGTPNADGLYYNGPNVSSGYLSTLGGYLQEAIDNDEDTFDSLIQETRSQMFTKLGTYLKVPVTVGGTPIEDENGDPLYFDGNPDSPTNGRLVDASHPNAEQALDPTTGDVLFDARGRVAYRDVLTEQDIQLLITESGIAFNVLFAGGILDIEVPLDFATAFPGFDLQSNTNLDLILGYQLGLGFGFDSSDGFYVDTAGVTETGDELVLFLDATIPDNTGFDASMFGLTASLESLADADGPSGLFGSFTVDLQDDGGDGRWTLFNPKDPGLEVLNIDARFTAEANVDFSITVSPPAALAGLGLAPITGVFTYDQQFLNAGTAGGTEFGEPPVVTIDFGDFGGNFLSEISPEDLTNGLFGVIDTIEGAVEEGIGALGNVPLLGDQILDAMSPLFSGLRAVRASLADVIDGVYRDAGSDPGTPFVVQFENALVSLLGSGGLNLLVDGDEIPREESLDGVPLGEAGVAPIPFTNWIEWDLHLGQSLPVPITIDIDLDLTSLGLPGDLFGIKVTEGGLVVTLEWDLRLGFGLTLANPASPFFVNGRAQDEEGDEVPELLASLRVEAGEQGLAGDVAFGFVVAGITDGVGDQNTKVELTAALDLQPTEPAVGIEPTDQSTRTYRVFADEPIADLLVVSAGAGVDLRLHIDGNSGPLEDSLNAAIGGLGGGGELSLPKISFDLVVDADARFINNVSTIDPIGLRFENVTLDAAFVGDLLSPIAGVVDGLLSPIFDVLGGGGSFLRSEVPLIAELAGLLNISPPTFLSLAGSENEAELNELITLIEQVAGAGASLATFLDQINEGVPIQFGCFEYDHALGTLIPCDLPRPGQVTLPDFTPLQEFTDALANFKAGFTVDLISLESVKSLLLGQPVDLVGYTIPELGPPDVGLNFGKDFGFSFSLNPGDFTDLLPDIDLASFNFDLDLNINIMLKELVFGYDSTGLERIVDAITAGVAPDFEDLLDGVYLQVHPGRELSFTASVSGGGEVILDLGPVEFGVVVDAGLSGGVFIDVIDPNNDGRLRLDAIFAVTDDFNDPAGLLALFDAGVNLAGHFDITGRFCGVDCSDIHDLEEADVISLSGILSPFGISPSFDIDLSFRDIFGEPDPPAIDTTPFLATRITDGGESILRVNTGLFANARVHGSTNDAPGRHVWVTEKPNGDVTVRMDLPGYADTQTYGGSYDRIVIVGANGGDTYDASSVTGIPVELRGGGGADTLIGGGSHDVLVGGPGGDTLLGGAGDDDLRGEAGNDTLDGETGADELRGGRDQDTLLLGVGDTVIDGDAGFDTVNFYLNHPVAPIELTAGGIEYNGWAVYFEQVEDLAIKVTNGASTTLTVRDTPTPTRIEGADRLTADPGLFASLGLVDIYDSHDPIVIDTFYIPDITIRDNHAPVALESRPKDTAGLLTIHDLHDALSLVDGRSLTIHDAHTPIDIDTLTGSLKIIDTHAPVSVGFVGGQVDITDAHEPVLVTDLGINGQVNITDTHAMVTVALHSGNLNHTTVTRLHGPLTVDGGHLVIDQTGQEQGRVGSLRDDKLRGLAGADITFSNLESLDITLGTGPDLLDVSGNPITIVTDTGGDSTITVTHLTNTFTIGIDPDDDGLDRLVLDGLTDLTWQSNLVIESLDHLILDATTGSPVNEWAFVNGTEVHADGTRLLGVTDIERIIINHPGADVRVSDDYGTGPQQVIINGNLLSNQRGASVIGDLSGFRETGGAEGQQAGPATLRGIDGNVMWITNLNQFLGTSHQYINLSDPDLGNSFTGTKRFYELSDGLLNVYADRQDDNPFTGNHVEPDPLQTIDTTVHLNNPQTLAVAGDRAIVTSTDGKMRLYDLNDDGDIILQARTLNPQSPPVTINGVDSRLLDNGRYLYVVEGSGADRSISMFDLLLFGANLYQKEQELSVPGTGDMLLIPSTVDAGQSVLYVTDEETDSIIVFARHPDGTLTEIQRVRNGVSGVRGLGGLSSIAIADNRRLLFAAGTRDNAVVAFQIGSDGELVYLENITRGVAGVRGIYAPYDLAVSGDHLFVLAHEDPFRLGQRYHDGFLLRDSLAAFDLDEVVIPTRYEVQFDADSNSITLETGAAGDQISVVNPAIPIHVQSRDGGDAVTVDGTAGNSNLIDLGDGENEFVLLAGARLEVIGGDDGTNFQVHGEELGPGVQVIGGVHTDDRLVFLGGDKDITPLNPTTPDGDVGVSGGEQLVYSGIEEIAVFGKLKAQFNATTLLFINTFPFPIILPGPMLEGDGPNRVTTLDATGTTTFPVGTDLSSVRYDWDINGDGVFGERTGQIVDGLRWADLVGLGIKDNGVYPITLRVTARTETGALLGVDKATQNITILNRPPDLTIQGPTEVDDRVPYELQLSTFDPGDDTVEHFLVDWGDGTPAEQVPAPRDRIEHLYEQVGVYEISVTAFDEDTSSLTEHITVTVSRTNYEISGKATTTEGTPYFIDLEATGTRAGNIDFWRIDWGEGVPEIVDGFLTTASHTYADDGIYTISAEAVDEVGGDPRPAVRDLVVVVGNAPQVLDVQPTSPTTIAEGEAFSLSLASNDPGADTLGSWRIDWGDGSISDLPGTVTGVSHFYADDGGYVVTASAQDEDGSYTLDHAIRVTVQNTAPTLSLRAVDSIFLEFVDEGAPYTVNLSSFDPGDDTIQEWVIVWGDGSEPQTVTGRTSAAHVYTESTGSGAYMALVASATDEDGTYLLSFESRVFVRVIERIPVATITGGAVVREGTPYRLALDVDDPGGDPVDSWAVDWGDGTQDTIAGDAAFAEHVYADDSAGAQLSITATVLQDGVTYPATVQDGDGQEVKVTVLNVAPTAEIGATALADARDPFELVLGPAVDPGADTVVEYRVTWGDGSMFDGKVYETFSGPGVASHVYEEPTPSLIRVSVVDEDGVFGVRSLWVVTEGTEFVLKLTALPPVQNPDLGYRIDWGDGTISEVRNSDADADGFINARHTYLGTDPEGDGYTVSVASGDLAGAALNAQPARTVFVNGVPDAPVVRDVLVSGVAWNRDRPDLLAPFSLINGVDPGLPLPWINLNMIEVFFDQDVLVEIESLSLTGVNTPVYPFLADDPTDTVAANLDGFRYDPDTFKATWILGSPIRADRLLLDISGQEGDSRPVRAADGRTLLNDGADFEKHFSVLPGDTNRNTVVSVTDVVNANARIQPGLFQPLYDSRFDLNGNGAITVTDIVNIVNRVPGFLPTGMPMDTDLSTPLEPPVTPVAGDFNDDGKVDAADIDLISLAIRNATDDQRYDLTGDGVIDFGDTTHLVEVILGTRFGDANLDQRVDLDDLTILSIGFGGDPVNGDQVGYGSGDFNGDGRVDLLDLTILSTNFGFDGTATLAAATASGQAGSEETSLRAATAPPVDVALTTSVVYLPAAPTNEADDDV